MIKFPFLKIAPVLTTHRGEGELAGSFVSRSCYYYCCCFFFVGAPQTFTCFTQKTRVYSTKWNTRENRRRQRLLVVTCFPKMMTNVLEKVCKTPLDPKTNNGTTPVAKLYIHNEPSIHRQSVRPSARLSIIHYYRPASSSNSSSSNG